MQDIPDTTCCAPGYPGGCQCGAEEKALRAWSDGRLTQPMTAAQREYCLSEIGSVEGYDRKEHEQLPDASLARATLSAWTDYCRDKGLL